MTIDTVVAWTAFIAIVFFIYVIPKTVIVRKAIKQKQEQKQKTKKKLPAPAPLLGVVYPSTEKPRQRKKKTQ